MDADGRQPHPPGRRVGRGPLHKRCVARMISYLLGEGTVSAPGTCDHCHDWAHRVQEKWYDENYH